MDGLTAKVFRTYNASITLQQQLKELTSRKPPRTSLWTIAQLQIKTYFEVPQHSVDLSTCPCSQLMKTSLQRSSLITGPTEL